MLRPTAALADFISSTEFEDLPVEVVEKAKCLVMDTIGVAIAGTKETSFHAAERFVRNLRASGISTAMASGLKTNAEWAVLVNGVAAHAVDFDDWHSAGGVHPGCIVIPAALAIAEERDSTGREFLKSVVVGYETMIRIGVLCGNRGFGIGFHPTSTCGVFGALAAVSSLLGLDAKQVENGFGIATSLSGGVQRYMQGGASVKHLHAGWAAHSGTIAAKLASLGYEAPEASLEGEYGFCHTHGQRACDARAFESFPEKFETLNVQVKAYPCCSELFSSIEATESLLRKCGINAQAIKKIKVQSINTAANLCSVPKDLKVKPPTKSDARFSLPFVIALMLLRGRVDLQSINDDTIRDNGVVEIARKVEPAVDPFLDRMFPGAAPAVVEIQTEDLVCRERVDYAKGTPENPMSEDEIISKFKACSAFAGFGRADSVVELLTRIDRLDKISEICRVFG
jgi:2-methylcitrate dehydratase PrpD